MRAIVALLIAGCGFAPAPPTTVADGNDVSQAWPCGAMPAPLGAQLAMMINGGATSFVITAIDVDAQGRMVVAAPSATVPIHLHYAITDTACAQCVDQLEIGWPAPGNRTSCLFDRGVPNPGGTAGDVATATITVPATPGVYDIRANIGQNYSCMHNGASTWWGAEPSEAQTLAKVCVH